jgi:HAMP domain-containing protein
MNWLGELRMEQFFYALIGLCGLLVVFRALIFAVRIYLHERQRGRPELAKGSTTSHWTGRKYEVATGQPVQAIQEPAQVDHEARYAGARARVERRAAIFGRGFRSLAGFYGNGLTGRMIITFSAIIATFGLLTIATVYFILPSSLKSFASARASATAVHISDSVPPFVFKKDIPGLRALLRNYAGQAGVAYVLVENRAGEILAHSFAKLPKEVERESPHETGREGSPPVLKVGQRAVHEVTVPVLDGRVGAVRLGIWHDHFNAEIPRTVTPLIKLILLVIGVGVILAAYLAWKINRPIVKLVKAAKSISTGDLDGPSLDVEDPTEFGELSRALERLRASVNAAMNRLNAER